MYQFLFTGSFSWFFVVAGTHKSLGVLYVDLLDLFQEGAFATSLVSMVFTFAWCLPCKLSEKFLVWMAMFELFFGIKTPKF